MDRLECANGKLKTPCTNMGSMSSFPMNVSVEYAITALEREMRQPNPREVALSEAHGLILARDLHALVDHPSLSDSALDGIACRVADTLGASSQNPVTLEVIGEVQAGRVFSGRLREGQAVRIYTGAPVPDGADGIVPVEVLEFVEGNSGTTVKVFQGARASDIRARGSDFERGQVGLTRGTRLSSSALALCAAMGHARVEVFRPLCIALLSTGDEIYEPGEPLPPGGVYNSNRYGLEAKIRSLGHEAVVLPRSVDTREALELALSSAGNVDLLLTSGGVSMGKFDLVRDLLIEHGEVKFWKIALRPGGPAMLGRWNDLPVFGLPGNPVSSLVVFEIIVRSALYKLLERPDAPHRILKATASTAFGSVPNKRAYWRARLEFENGHPVVSDFVDQRSSVLRSMVENNALVVIEPGQSAPVGAEVEVIWL